MSARDGLPERVVAEALPAELLEAIHEEARLCPMFAGASRIRGGRLTVRKAGEDIEIAAPGGLLELVFDRCDGTRTIPEIVASVPARRRGEVADFVRFLLGEGALVDASLACAHAARLAFQSSPFGAVAPARVTDRICRRFARGPAASDAAVEPARVGPVPLDNAFASRVSTYTFDDASIGAEALHAFLWSMAGIVRMTHERVGDVMPRRTVASAGGMHLLEVYVALRRAVGERAPGVYRVRYPGEREIVLERVGDSELLLRAFMHPWELTFATGAVFLAADPVIGAMRYRNRSLQYLFMEAGAVLHNAGLSADPLGIGFATIGGYDEATIARLCNLDAQLVLGSGIFGARPTPEQRQAVWRTPDLEFSWLDTESKRYSIGFHLARAQVKTPEGDRPYTWGRSTDPALAARKAMAEAVEREGFREPRGIVAGTLAAVRGALDPRQFVCYSGAQLRGADFPYQAFDAAHEYTWTEGRDLVTGEPVRVLAELVFARGSLNQAGFASPRPYAQATTSGCAAGVSREDALHRALLEVCERDAFMRHWLEQRPGFAVSTRLAPPAVQARLEALAATGCRVSLQRLDSPWASVALVAAQHEQLHFTTMATAADAIFWEAAAGAVDEIEARVYAWLHAQAPSIRSPADVVTPDHHFELYGLARYFRRANPVLFPDDIPGPVDAVHRRGAESAAALVAHFASRGIHPVGVDITPRQCFIDQGRTALTVVKAMVPGLIPVSFGHRREPLGMMRAFHRAATFPHPFP